MSRRSRTLADQLRERLQTDGVKPSALSEIFSEQPPTLTEFNCGQKYLYSPALSDVQFDAVRHMEQIYEADLYPAMVEEWGEEWMPVRFVNLITLEWGKGSGKDHICRVSNLRVVNLLLCLKSPQEYYNLPPQDSIHTLNVATSAQQANRAFFKPLKRAVERKGGWFTDKCQPTDYSVMFDKGVEAVSGHSLADTLEGLNLMFSTADELSAFRLTEEIMVKGLRDSGKSVESILKMLRTSSRTRFPRVFKMAAISYPRFLGDAIQQEVAKAVADLKAKGEASRRYVSGPLATWEVNPRITGPEDFEEDYEEDPVMARTMYECKPELSTDLFFKNKAAIYASFIDDDKPEPIQIEYYWGRSDPREKVDGWQVRFIFRQDFWPVDGAQYAMHGDIGITKDAAGIAMAHCTGYQLREWVGKGDEDQDVVIEESRPLIKLDFVTSFSADKRTKTPSGELAPREVQIRWYRALLWEMKQRGFNVVRYTFDGFQSTELMQDFVSWGIEAERVSTDINTLVWDSLRDVMYDGRLDAQFRLRAVKELESLSKLPNGRVDHPPYGSKDEADAVGGAVLGATILGGIVEQPTQQVYPDANPIMVGKKVFTLPESLLPA